MEEYIGLDVSMKQTAVSIRRDGKRVWRGKCVSDPKLIAQLIHKRAPSAIRVVLKMAPYPCGSIMRSAEGLPAICMDARHAKAALDITANKTDANDGPRVREMIEAANAGLLYLPPYSPDFNPIENAFSKLKAHLRKTADAPAMASGPQTAASSTPSRRPSAETTSLAPDTIQLERIPL